MKQKKLTPMQQMKATVAATRDISVRERIDLMKQAREKAKMIGLKHK